MTNDELQSRLSFIDFTDQQRQALAALQERIGPLLSSTLERFYTKVEQTPETKAFFRDRGHMGGAKSAQEAHWRHITSARFDDGYYQSVRRIGATHARIGLPPRWYVGAYSMVLEGLIRGLGASEKLKGGWLPIGSSAEAQLEGIVAVVKAALLDMELSISIYLELSQKERDQAMASLEAREKELNDLLGTVSQSADSVLTGAREIAQASEDLARRTESNAASLEETAAAIAQMDGRLKATAGAAADTVSRADQAITTVASGRSVAVEAVEAMGRVSESAKGIDSVIEGLDKIAFQTRVLAMNAAVEAGRAGEAGRGFAVVADLVSSLAMRAEEEAKRARDQLTVTQADVVSAVGAVEKVDGALQAISSDVEQVHKLLATIAEDNRNQAGAVTEINSAIASMDHATQQNAAMVEETSAAARNLVAEANQLSEQSSRFSPDGANGGSVKEVHDPIGALRPLKQAA